MDRASTNKKAIADMSKLENPPIEWPCHSHTLCKPGDTLAEEAKLSNEFCKYYNKGIMFRGKMFDVVKDVFNQRQMSFVNITTKVLCSVVRCLML